MQKQGSSQHHNFFTKRLFFSLLSRFTSHRGQMLSEYGIVILIVVSAATAMVIFTKRAIQARAHDAQQKVMQVAGENLHGKRLPMEYEPYYYESSTVTIQDQTDSVFKSFDQRYHKEQQSSKTSNVYSTQYAPSD